MNAGGETESGRQRLMTVAHVRQNDRLQATEVAFLESARFFRLPNTHAGHDEIVAKLQRALDRGRKIRVTVTVPHGDLIESVDESE